MKKLVKIEKDIDVWNVLTTRNGTQWTSVYYDKSYLKAVTILTAFAKIGYEEVI